MKKISPKVLIPAIVQLAGALVLALLVGDADQEALAAAISGLLTLILGGSAPPAAAVTQEEVFAISDAKLAEQERRGY